MKINSEKGFTGIDITVSVIILFIFISLISMLIYNFNSSSREIELKSEATYLAIDEIEKIKSNGIDIYNGISKKNGNNEISNSEEIKEGFYKTITILDYTDMEGNEDKISDIIKKVTVEIKYMFKGSVQTVKLTTILTKEA